jgi:hypothetical protein
MKICCKWEPNGWKDDNEAERRNQQENEQLMNIFNGFYFIFVVLVLDCAL